MDLLRKIYSLLEQSENSALEFKTEKVHPDSLAKEIVAFANSQGGTILLGINDKKDIEGIGGDRNWEEWVANISRNNVTPPVLVEYCQVSIEDSIVGIVDVAKGRDKPYQTNKNQFLVRVGSTSRVASQSELMRMFQQAGVFHYDLTAVDRTTIKDINVTKVANYFQRYDIDLADEDDLVKLLQNTDVLTADGQVTVAGLLIFGLQPQRYLLNSSVSYAHYAGNEVGTELLDRKTIEGTLDYQVENALPVIKNNFLESSVIKGAKREISNILFPDKVLRELLVNAVVHRNYAIVGSRIRILHFADRLEFISPGRLPNTVTIEKLKSGVSYAVNPVIVKFMENMRFIDKLGRGIPMVVQTLKKLDLVPSFAETGEEFRVVLPFNNHLN